MRLIDADKLKSEFETWSWTEYTKEAVVKIISNQPTSYDMDKVVKRLRLSDLIIDQEKCITVEDAISLLKGAVKDE
jgi:competence protein ComGC